MNITSPASADIIFTESINSISGLGPKTKSAAALNKIGIFTIADLLFHFPTSYTDRTNIIHIGDLTPLYEGTEVTISGIITSTKLDSRPRGSIFQVTLSDGTGYIRLSFFNFKKFQQDALRINTEITIYGRLSFFNNQPQLANPEFLSPNENSESLTPSYALTAGIKQQAMRRYIKQALDFLSAHDVPEYLPTALNRYHLTLKEALQLVHQPPKNTDLQVLARFETPAQAKNTMTFSLAAVPLAVVLSLLLAMLMESRIPCKSQFRTFFLSPMMVPIASIILIWQVLFHYNGVINEFLQVFGADKIDWLKSDYCMVVIVVLFLWKNLGYNMILFMAALSNIPRELLEVAEVEGASAAYQFFHIKLRYLSPTVLFVTILSIINSFKVFREIYLLTGNYPYDGLYMMQHFMNNMFNSADYQRLSAAAVLLAIVIVILIALLFFVENIFGKDVEG